tara:strand:+ start:439 stop:1071 length:633 start_codon:yes stop_codon:yes gene_type:complete
MTNTDIKKIYNNYLAKVIPPDFELDKGILYKTPVNEILVGFCFEKSSSEKESLYVWSFAMPLYIEKDNISLTFGQRLKDSKGNELWHLKNNQSIDKAIARLASLMYDEIESFFPVVETPENFYRFYKDKGVKNIRINEALVYSAIYSKSNRAKEIMKDFIAELEEEDLEIGWIKNVLLKAKELEKMIDDNHKAKAYLSKNISETKSNLSL